MVTYYKVTSPNREFWYGTFKTREDAIKRMKKDYPKLEIGKDYLITEKQE